MKRWTHNEISKRYREILAPILNITEDTIPSAWSPLIHRFADIWERVSARYWSEVTPEILRKEIVEDISNNL